MLLDPLLTAFIEFLHVADQLSYHEGARIFIFCHINHLSFYDHLLSSTNLLILRPVVLLKSLSRMMTWFLFYWREALFHSVCLQCILLSSPVHRLRLHRVPHGGSSLLGLIVAYMPLPAWSSYPHRPAYHALQCTHSSQIRNSCSSGKTFLPLAAIITFFLRSLYINVILVAQIS